VRNVRSKEARRHGCTRAATSGLAQQALTPSAAGDLRVHPEEVVLQLETRAHLRAALEALPKCYRRVVTMRALHGCTHDEIGEVLDTPGPLIRLWYCGLAKSSGPR
jgi:DNA-directed RNA polymerase specialized sigma24 family protein